MAAKRLTRKEIVHKDPIQIALEGTSSWIVNNRTLLTLSLVILCLAVLGVYGWNTYSSSRQDKMQVAFAEGLELYHGTVKPEQDQAPAADANTEEIPSEEPEASYNFTSDRERLTKSLESFQLTAEEYKGTKIGDLALYYTALCSIELGDTDKAEASLQKLISDSDFKEVRNLARNSASQLASEKKDLDRAVALLEEIVAEPSDNYPVQFTLMNIAMLQEAAGNTDQAIAAYQRVATEYGETSSAAEARTKIASLDPKGKKAPSTGEAAASNDSPPAEE